MSLFLAPTNPQLNEPSFTVCPCSIRKEETQRMIDQMMEIAYGETQDRSRAILVGLAAPQIGFQKRIILVDTAATGVFTADSSPPPPKIEVFINPEIVWKSDQMISWREGCYSTGRVCGIVARPEKILIRAYDREGNLKVEEYTGYVARIFQHEIDHLDGIRFPDRISDDSLLHWVEEEEIPEYRINWANWPKTARTAWEKMKNGF